MPMGKNVANSENHEGEKQLCIIPLHRDFCISFKSFFCVYISFFSLLFLASLGLPCCPQTFFSCWGGRGAGWLSGFHVPASHCGGCHCETQTLGCKSSLVAYGLSCSSHVGTSQTRNQTCVLCTGRWMLNHWGTREVLFKLFIRIITLHIYIYIYII